MRKGSLGVARRYARALLDVALEQGAAEAARADLSLATALLSGNKEVAAAVAHPAVPAIKKTALVRALWQRSGGGALLGRLLEMLVERGRIQALPQVEDAFVSLYNAHRRIVAAEAVSAVTLDPPQRAALTAALEKASGLAVELRSTVDPAVLGGLVVRMGGRVYDGSVRARLHSLRERLSGAPHA